MSLLLLGAVLVGDHRGATRAATGALVGRVAAIALKVAVGCIVIAWILVAAGV